MLSSSAPPFKTGIRAHFCALLLLLCALLIAGCAKPWRSPLVGYWSANGAGMGGPGTFELWEFISSGNVLMSVHRSGSYGMYSMTGTYSADGDNVTITGDTTTSGGQSPPSDTDTLTGDYTYKITGDTLTLSAKGNSKRFTLTRVKS